MITLDNVTFSNKKQRPCIRMADHADLRLRLIGENKLLGGGILVPESSTLTIEGDGNLRIHMEGNDLFGIGNEFGKKHGSLVFYQEGEVTIEANGMNMVGIGSELGGSIRINKGKYSLYMSGNKGVGIGSFKGSEDLLIHDCDLYTDITFREGVCVGSLYSDMKLEAMIALLRLNCGGTRMALIGTVAGKSAYLHMHDLACILSPVPNCVRLSEAWRAVQESKLRRWLSAIKGREAELIFSAGRIPIRSFLWTVRTLKPVFHPDM